MTHHPLTFLFTDLENSTRLWEQFPDAMRPALARHDALVRTAVEHHHGKIVKTTGDGLHAVFESPADGIAAALTAQQSINAETWPSETGPLKVRMGLHTGESQERDGDYYGPTLNRAARVMGLGYGGQILVSEVTAVLIRNVLPPHASLTNLGEHRLKGLSTPEQIFQLAHPDLPATFPPLNSLTASRHNLPVQLTSFIGREKEVAELKAMLNAGRLVTLTGSGGTGKTRLSIEVGTEELPSFANGVWLIELAPLTDPAQIIPALAQVFGLQELPFRPLVSLVTDYLRDKKLLLLLDNCEHLIEACARLADDLLHQCAGLKILASSREALGIAGEMAYHTPSLAESESTRLFVERAHAANSNFALTDANASSVTQICSRLDGIPLAIELAAARTKLFSVDQIAARLDDLFRLLVGGSRTALPRQQTLRALIDWSYDLLSEEERQLLRTASVFVSGWTLDALEAVSDDPNAIEHLEGLVNKSLVVNEERRNEMRYFMLETIRQYAREKLFEAKQSSAARDRHFIYFDELAEKLWNAFVTQSILAWRDRADDEVENLRAAVEWGLENHVEESIGLAANYCVITGWIGGHQTNGLALCKSAIERVNSLPPVDGSVKIQRQKLMAKALFSHALVGMSTGNMLLVLKDLQEAIACARAAGDKRILGYSLEIFYIAGTFINAPGTVEAAEEGYAIFRDEVDDKWGLSMGYQNMSRIASSKGDLTEREKYITKFKEHIREAPLSFQAGMFYLGVGMHESTRGNYEAAKTYFEDGLNIFKYIRNRNFQLIMTSELGHVARRMGKISEAKKIYNETIKNWQDRGNRPSVANQLECFAFIALTEEEPQRAAKLLGAAESLRDEGQSPMTDFERIEYDQSVAQLRAMLSEAEFNTLWAEGRAMTMEQAIQFALNEF